MDTINRSLCSPCAQVFYKDYNVGRSSGRLTYKSATVLGSEKICDVLTHHISYLAFEESAKQSCHLCLLFWNQVPEDSRVALRGHQSGGIIRIDEYTAQLDPFHNFDISLYYSYPPDLSYLPTASQITQGLDGFSMRLHMRSILGKTSREIILLFGSYWFLIV